MQFKPLSLALALALAPAAHAENLSTVFQDAQAYDAQYAAARAAYQAGQEKAVQGRAGLLPNVNLGGNVQYNKIDSSLPGGDADYASNGLSVNATQPLFRKSNLAYLAIAICVIITINYGLFPGSLLHAVKKAALF